MKPIGLTCKHDGEIMVVHLCLHCGKISCNRIAGDDDPHIILSLLKPPTNLAQGALTHRLRRTIRLLTQHDTENVLVSLYGYT